MTCTLSLLLLLSDCADHTLAPLVIKTLPFTSGITFKVEVTALGDKPVTEYGIVYTAYFRASQDPHILDPTINNSKIIFPAPFQLGTSEYLYPTDFFQGRTFFYYRAYAIQNDGSVAYGNRIGYRFPDPF